MVTSTPPLLTKPSTWPTFANISYRLSIWSPKVNKLLHWNIRANGVSKVSKIDFKNSNTVEPTLQHSIEIVLF